MKKLAVFSIATLTISAIYLYAWPAPNVFYAAVVLLHVGLGVLFCIGGLRMLPKVLKQPPILKLAALVMIIGAALGLALIYSGASRPYTKLLLSHGAVSFLAVALFAGWWYSRRKVPCTSAWVPSLSAIAVAVLITLGAQYTRNSWSKQFVIRNPEIAPLSMNNEGDGANGKFFPSSSQVYGDKNIPSKFFMESDACERCHQDIFKQWNSSAHHFSSFNNQWYRKSIEYMQEVNGVKPSKWCAGCHDPALLYSGMMDTPIKQIVNTPQAQAGMGCMMCHSIVSVKSTMGQGDFQLEYPELHELAATKNPVLRWVHDFSIKLNPEPHRRVFLKPFMKDQAPEFCSSCHKVHLDVPVNNYRWFRGFNEYDNWQASGVSGFGARSFYYPPKAQGCQDCHMPDTKSNDMGNIAGKVHSHSFPAANTALPTANQDQHQLELTENFLKSGALTIDIFALSNAAAKVSVGGGPQSELQTTFAVGEEAEMKTTGESSGVVAPVTAPLDKVQGVVTRGESARVDVVVRTKKIGHFFPGGTVDAFDTWVELKAVDDKGQVIFWSGKVEDDGKGPVDPGAHFYRSLQIDEHGNAINKRNAWSTRSVVYVRLIPPGAADTIHYRLNLPQNVGNKITLTAKLCYRKFSWWNTHFAYAGVSNQEAVAPQTTKAYDDRQFAFDGDLTRVSGKLHEIPDLPVVVIAEDTIELKVLPKGAKPEAPKTVVEKTDWQRWNDYGIGLFLQGDFKGATAAWEKVTEADPGNPDGWVNLGRVAVQEGDMERARTVLNKALAINQKLARANYFYARVLRSDGDYDGAAQRLLMVAEQYPKDRVVRNDLGRTYFLARKYPEAIEQLNLAIAVDPEDLQANYNLMLAYKGIGDAAKAAEYEKLYLRFKADESAQVITGPYRRLHPEDNNERQLIHEHGSAPLTPAKSAKKPPEKVADKRAVSAGGK
jgi:tetratricopeptide (TPR) repeat protein